MENRLRQYLEWEETKLTIDSRAFGPIRPRNNRVGYESGKADLNTKNSRQTRAVILRTSYPIH